MSEYSFFFFRGTFVRFVLKIYSFRVRMVSFLLTEKGHPRKSLCSTQNARHTWQFMEEVSCFSSKPQLLLPTPHPQFLLEVYSTVQYFQRDVIICYANMEFAHIRSPYILKGLCDRQSKESSILPSHQQEPLREVWWWLFTSQD